MRQVDVAELAAAKPAQDSILAKGLTNQFTAGKKEA